MYRLIDYATQISDRRRIDAYRRALASIITPETILLDLGSGLGTFSVIAARLGARRVYAIEASDVISVAAEIARNNGVADRITFIHGRSTDVTLPEMVDVIVSDLASALPLFENHIPTIIDARQRFLRPGGTLIPERATLFCAPVSDPSIPARITTPWSSVPEVDFTAARTLAFNAPQAMRVRPEDLCGEPQVWGELDYLNVLSPNLSATMRWRVTKPVHAIALWFRNTTQGEFESSSGPWEEDSVHATIVLPLPETIEAGEITVSLDATLADGRYAFSWHARSETAVASPSPDARIRAVEGVLARKVRDDLVLFDPGRGLYHALNETGAEVWRALEKPTTVRAIARSIADAFDVDVARAEADVSAVIAELGEAALIESVEAQRTSRSADAPPDRDDAPST